MTISDCGESIWDKQGEKRRLLETRKGVCFRQTVREGCLLTLETSRSQVRGEAVQAAGPASARPWGTCGVEKQREGEGGWDGVNPWGVEGGEAGSGLGAL